MPSPSARLLGLVVAVALLTACSSEGDDADAAVAGGDGVFPVTVEHAFGTTTVESEPTRIVTAGVTEQDAVLALGVVPVGITDWYGEQPHAVWPWAQDELGDAEPTVLSSADGLQFEAIAAVEPDLIVATNAGLTEDDYAKLSEIAPTVAHSDDDYFEPWDTQALAIGTAMGKEAEVRELIADVQGQFADAAAAHPEFAGTPAAFLQNAVYDGDLIAYQEGLSTAFLTDLGFTVPASLDAFATEGQAFVPLEQASVLDDADVLIWGTEADGDRAALEELGVYRALEAVQGGHLVFTGPVLAGAIYFTSLLSLPYVLDELVPLLEAAVAGAPSTVPAD
ncbi:ABC transporter substrate-binding protein [Modestobacter versicolor]|uniref:Iron complex transport system substrate-binding protein n=1 Tax=Modestobacter versicolor TaxID=429133 RepID=A0A839Y8C2_9ACTN|nr:iron-siderophore ABC transporter substrate-binding protein [Modestobacter versicolor]MBB3677141.1 iron complex transport system substrate-binding protein [Modestobacter versicolor]